MDLMYEAMSAYEMRNFESTNLKKEVSFKASKKEDDVFLDDNLDDVEANFVRRLKKGADKYKGKLPLKCFNCERSGHFSAPCPYREESNRRRDDKGMKIDDREDKPKCSFYSKDSSH